MKRAAALLLTLATPAWADEAPPPGPEPSDKTAKRACIAAHAGVQRARARQRLSEAREHAQTCGSAECPDVIRDECSTWLTELANEQPTIVLAARDEAGRTVTNVTVRLGDKVLARRIDGQPIEIDPGLHTLRFDGREHQILVRAAEKGQLVELVVPAPPKADPPRGPSAPPLSSAPSTGLPTASWVLGGVAAAGFLSAGYFGLAGLSQQRDLESTCAPRCPGGDVDDMQRSYAIADVSLGVALVATAGAIWAAVAGREAPAARSAVRRSR
ncbi:MAG: hypothetical protein IT377_15470 [Polyangiaceae bacterium]|nr:hypothetical protein [Polyangiaceae bacterium]